MRMSFHLQMEKRLQRTSSWSDIQGKTKGGGGRSFVDYFRVIGNERNSSVPFVLLPIAA